MQEEELPEEGNLVDLAFRNPAEIERQVVERRDIDHRIMVQYDNVTFTPIDMLQSDNPLPPEGRNGEKDPHKNARKTVHHTARTVERGAEHQRHGRKNHEKGAQQHQKQVIKRAYHSRPIGHTTIPHAVRSRSGTGYSRKNLLAKIALFSGDSYPAALRFFNKIFTKIEVPAVGFSGRHTAIPSEIAGIPASADGQFRYRIPRLTDKTAPFHGISPLITGTAYPCPIRSLPFGRIPELHGYNPKKEMFDVRQYI